MDQAIVWKASDLDKLVEAFVRDRLTALRKQTKHHTLDQDQKASQQDDRFDHAPWFMDSIELLTLAAQFGEQFGVYDAGLEDLLLAKPGLGRWSELLARAWNAGDVSIRFASSGSTGTPKTFEHKLSRLVSEVLWFADKLQTAQIQRIVSMVPPYHIYGFLWTVLLPAVSAIPVVKAGPLHRRFQAGDLVVTVPTHLGTWARSNLDLPSILRVLLSTAPLVSELERWLVEQRIDALEIYGSSETGGLGYRSIGHTGFLLFPWWKTLGQDTIQGPDHVEDTRTGKVYTVPDELQVLEGGRYLPLARRDKAVQVCGVNVYPMEVQQVLESLNGVKHARVRLDTKGQEPRLKALIVPAEMGVDHSTIEAYLREAMAERFATPQRPARYSFATQVPITDMGKEADWD